MERREHSGVRRRRGRGCDRGRPVARGVARLVDKRGLDSPDHERRSRDLAHEVLSLGRRRGRHEGKARNYVGHHFAHADDWVL